MKKEILDEVLLYIMLQIMAFCIWPMVIITPDKCFAVYITVWIIGCVTFIAASCYIWIDFALSVKDIKKKYGRK